MAAHALTLVQRSFRHHADELGRRVVHGASLAFLGVLLRTTITIGSLAVLARLLTPAEFGHVAMATIVVELGALFANFGFGPVLVQRPRITRIQLDTMFWASVVLGAALTATVTFLSFFMDAAFEQAVVGDLLRVLCITLILEELTVVPYSILSRLLMFREILITQVAMLLFRAGMAIAMAWWGCGVWSLVGGALVGSLVQCLVYWYYAGYQPRWRFNWSFLKSTWRMNGSYFGNGVLFYLNSNIDLFLVGRQMGPTALGYFQNARGLTDEIRTRIGIPLQRVLFPAFAVIQNDLNRFQQGVSRSGRLLALIVIPIGTGIAGIAEELVPLLYGEQWTPMVPILQIIAVGAGIKAATSTAIPIFSATNRVGLSMRLNALATVFVVSSIYAGTYWGLTGVAYALLFGALLNLIVFRVALGLIELRTSDLWQMLGPPFIASVAMLAIIAGSRALLLAEETAPFARLGILVAIGVSVYAGVVLLIARRHVLDAVEAVGRLRLQRE